MEITTQNNGTMVWRLNGLLHRDGDLPAIWHPDCVDGDGEWYKHGVRHREGGPAEVFGNTKFWYFNGKAHRDFGLPSDYYDDGDLG